MAASATGNFKLYTITSIPFNSFVVLFITTDTTTVTATVSAGKQTSTLAFLNRSSDLSLRPSAVVTEDLEDSVDMAASAAMVDMVVMEGSVAMEGSAMDTVGKLKMVPFSLNNVRSI